MKADVGGHGGVERIMAVGRFVQVLVSGGGGATESVAGGLYMLGEVSFFVSFRTVLIGGVSAV